MQIIEITYYGQLAVVSSSWPESRLTCSRTQSQSRTEPSRTKPQTTTTTKMHSNVASCSINSNTDWMKKSSYGQAKMHRIRVLANGWHWVGLPSPVAFTCLQLNRVDSRRLPLKAQPSDMPRHSDSS